MMSIDILEKLHNYYVNNLGKFSDGGIKHVKTQIVALEEITFEGNKLIRFTSEENKTYVMFEKNNSAYESSRQYLMVANHIEATSELITFLHKPKAFDNLIYIYKSDSWELRPDQSAYAALCSMVKFFEKQKWKGRPPITYGFLLKLHVEMAVLKESIRKYEAIKKQNEDHAAFLKHQIEKVKGICDEMKRRCDTVNNESQVDKSTNNVCNDVQDGKSCVLFKQYEDLQKRYNQLTDKYNSLVRKNDQLAKEYYFNLNQLSALDCFLQSTNEIEDVANIDFVHKQRNNTNTIQQMKPINQFEEEHDQQINHPIKHNVEITQPIKRNSQFNQPIKHNSQINQPIKQSSTHNKNIITSIQTNNFKPNFSEEIDSWYDSI